MGRGRKPLPGKIHQLHGTKRDDRHGGEIELEAILPDPPDRLTGEARAEWLRISPDLHNAGVLTALDLVPLEMYCNAWAQYRKAIDDISVDGVGAVSRTPNGYKQQSAEFQVVNVCEKRVLSFLSEFGMTPATRARIKLINQKPKQLDLLSLLDEVSQAKANNG